MMLAWLRRGLTCLLASAFLLSLVDLFPGVNITLAEAEEIHLTVGSRGDEVLSVKKRLKELRYYSASSFTKKYTEDTAEVVRTFQAMHGLPETGEVNQSTWDLLFSDAALPKPWPTLRPLVTPAPIPELDAPETDSEGFLSESGEYFFESDDAGVWIYIGQKLRVVIRRNVDTSIPLTWFETEIWLRGGEALRTVATDPAHPGKVFRYPYVISRDEKFVLAFSDDFYGNRIARKETVGLIVREGSMISTATNSKTGHYLPNLDMMAQFPDGTLAVYACNEKTAAELVETGAVNVFSFGPILLRDGRMNDLVYTYYKSLEPRQALGMIEPNHYLLISVQGRTDESEGVTLQRVAELMRERGVTDALNLDGGNTMALIFRGRMLNKLAVYKRKKFVRTVTSLIGVGYTEQQEE